MIKMEEIPATPRDVRKFGLLFAVVGVLLSGLNMYKQGSMWPILLACAGVFLIGGYFAQPVVRPIYIVWMKFAFILGWVNTRIILGLAYYLIVTPMGLLMRMFGKDSLGLKMDKQRGSYWIKRETPYEPHQTEHQF